MAKKSPHFTAGTWVLSQNVRGFITHTSERGDYLRIEWEDGRVGTIKNPRDRNPHFASLPITPLALSEAANE